MNYPQDGVYGGLEAGIARVSVRGNFVIDKGTDLNEHITKDYSNLVVSANLGYGYYIAESFVGIEAHYSVYTNKISETFTQGDFDFDISIGSKSELDLIIGRKIGSRSLLTLRGGVAFSNATIIANNNLNNDITTLDKKWNGFSIGMGYVYGINENLSLKSKYNLSTIKNKQNPDTNSEIADNRFTLSLIYRIWSRD